MAQVSASQTYFPALTGLRFVAAFAVVFSHILVWRYPPDAEHGAVFSFFSTLSAFGMTLFFVLSGFVIHSNYSQVIAARDGLRSFFVARFARLYPLFFLTLCADLVLSRPPSQELAALPFYLTMTQSWLYLLVGGKPVVGEFGAVAQVSWSISTEFFFYVAFPAICMALPAARRRPMTAIVVLCVSSITLMLIAGQYRDAINLFGQGIWGDVGGAWITGFYRWLCYFSPYSRILEFMLGMLVSVLVQETSKPAARWQGSLLFAVAAIGALVLQWKMFGERGAPWSLLVLHLNFGFAPFAALMIFVCAKYDIAVVRFLAAWPIVLLGDASYSMYLAHPILVPRYQNYLRGSPEIFQVLSMFVLVACVSLISSKIIEMPARRWIRHLLAPRPVALNKDGLVTSSG